MDLINRNFVKSVFIAYQRIFDCVTRKNIIIINHVALLRFNGTMKIHNRESRKIKKKKNMSIDLNEVQLVKI